MPVHLHYFHANQFFTMQFQFIDFNEQHILPLRFQQNGYLGIFTLVLLVQYISIVVVGFPLLYLLFFVSCDLPFFTEYYKYGRNA